MDCSSWQIERFSDGVKDYENMKSWKYVPDYNEVLMCYQ